jgi:hypothetical protein
VVKNLHKNFYTLFDQQHFSNISDMIVDTTIDSMKLNNKKFFVFSWETRRTKNELYYPIVNCGDRLEDGHLNSNGTKKLFDKIQEQLGSP